MPAPESTCWTVIRAAAAGSAGDRDELARRYRAVIRAYLAARWRGSPLRPDLEDAVQEVFVECFRQGGALEPGSGPGPFSRDNSGKNLRKSGKRCQQAGGLLLHLGRAARVMKGHHL